MSGFESTITSVIVPGIVATLVAFILNSYFGKKIEARLNAQSEINIDINKQRRVEYGKLSMQVNLTRKLSLELVDVRNIDQNLFEEFRERERELKDTLYLYTDGLTRDGAWDVVHDYKNNLLVLRDNVLDIKNYIDEGKFHEAERVIQDFKYRQIIIERSAKNVIEHLAELTKK